MHPVGEVGAARAAGNAGTAYILSTISGHKLENVKAASTGPVFYQLYLMGGRAAAEGVIERARVAGFSALVVTIDTPVSGIRERDYRNGMKELVSGSALRKTSLSSASPLAPGMAGQLSARWRPARAPQRRGSRQRSDAARRCRHSPRRVRRHLERPQMDSRTVARPDRRQRRPHRRRRAPRRRRRRRGNFRLQSWRPPARLRSLVLASLAGGRQRRSTDKPKS